MMDTSALSFWSDLRSIIPAPGLILPISWATPAALAGTWPQQGIVSYVQSQAEIDHQEHHKPGPVGWGILAVHPDGV